MDPEEHTVPRIAAPPPPPLDAVAALEDTVGRGEVPAGPRFDSPPPVRLAPPPSGPALGARHRVRIGDAAPVVLTAPVVVGRAPGRPRLGGPVVRVPVPSPRMQVSGDHLEIVQEGSTVVLRDLRSTNGSTVTVPGQPPRLLARGDSIAVPVGTVVDLGDEVRLEILAPAESPGA